MLFSKSIDFWTSVQLGQPLSPISSEFTVAISTLLGFKRLTIFFLGFMDVPFSPSFVHDQGSSYHQTSNLVDPKNVEKARLYMQLMLIAILDGGALK